MKTWGIFLLVIAGLLASAHLTHAAPIVPGSFSTTWKTDNSGPSNDDQVAINTQGGGYNYDIYWEEVGNDTINGSSTGNTGNVTITFPDPGTYRVDITGDFPRLVLGPATDSYKILTVEQWGNIPWTSMASAFSYAENLNVLAIDNPDLSNVTDMSLMFFSASEMNEDISVWDVSNVTQMSYIFGGATAFNQPLNSWDVSNVTDMSYMFNNATSFNQDISTWNVANVSNMKAVFNGAEAFNQPLNSWNVSNVTEMDQMFDRATAFNQPLNSWNVSNVTEMDQMFGNATSFNQPLNSWDVSNVTSISFMFDNATSFNQDISTWNVANVSNMESVFGGATAFNQPLNSWNVSNVTDMSYMFNNATSFNQDISTWNVANVSNMEDIFIDSALSETNYTAILTSWAPLVVQTNVYFATDAQYCGATAQAARDTLTSAPNNWIIADGGATDVCVIEGENESSGGSSATRVGDRIKSYFTSSSTDSVTATAPFISVTKESFIQSVRDLIDYLTKNEEDLQNLTPEESTKLIVGLRDIIAFILMLTPGV